MEKDIKDLFQEKLGMRGKMISASKSGYRNRFPENFVVFNSNLCTEEDGKVWYGDLDISLSKEELAELAIREGKKIYVLYEMDARFENEEKPLLGNSPIVFFPDGTYSLKKGLEDTKI